MILVTAVPFGCARSTDTCTCYVENGGEQRTLSCGDTSCLAGLSYACVDKNTSVQRGSCTEPAPTTTAVPIRDSGSTAPPDTSCDDLRTFCSTSCNKPATTASDCLSTASTGDPATCASWQATNGVLCRP